MINIHRVLIPEISYLLLPFYVPVDKSRLQIGQELHKRLKEDPDNTFCVIGEENGVCYGFIVAYIENKTCFIWQARASLYIYREVKKVWKMLLQWAREKGAEKVEMIQAGHEKAYKRKYGFELDENGGMVLWVINNPEDARRPVNLRRRLATRLNRGNG